MTQNGNTKPPSIEFDLQVDYDSAAITENTRVSYPIEFMGGCSCAPRACAASIDGGKAAQSERVLAGAFVQPFDAGPSRALFGISEC